MKRTMYQAARHTPKGEAGGSIPFWRAKTEPLQVILGGLQRFIFYRHILFCEIIEGRKHALLLSTDYQQRQIRLAGLFMARLDLLFNGILHL